LDGAGTKVANLAFLKQDFEILFFFQSERLGSGKTLSELHIPYKSHLKRVYKHAGCKKY